MSLIKKHEFYRMSDDLSFSLFYRDKRHFLDTLDLWLWKLGKETYNFRHCFKSGKEIEDDYWRRKKIKENQ